MALIVTLILIGFVVFLTIYTESWREETHISDDQASVRRDGPEDAGDDNREHRPSLPPPLEPAVERDGLFEATGSSKQVKVIGTALFFFALGVAFPVVMVDFLGKSWSVDVVVWGAFLFCVAIGITVLKDAFGGTTNGRMK